MQAIFHVTVIPDLQLATTTSPTNATAHTTVTTTAAATNIGATSRKTTITYTVYFVDASGNQTVVAKDVTDGNKGTNSDPVTVSAGAFVKLQLLTPGETAVPGTA